MKNKHTNVRNTSGTDHNVINEDASVVVHHSHDNKITK